MSARKTSATDVRTVWLVHGLGDSPLVWQSVRRKQELKGYRFIKPALPGHGGADPLPQRERGLDGTAHWLQSAIEEQGDPVILVGHSMGGMIATLLGARCALVAGVVNVEGPLLLADCDTAKKASQAKDFARWFASFRDSVKFQTSNAPLHYARSVARADALTFLACARGIVALTRNGEMARTYSSLQVPAVYYYGDARDGISKASREFLRSGGLAVKRFRGAGHWPMIDQPEEFRAALSEALGSIRDRFHAHAQGVSTAAPSSRPARRSAKASLARSSG
ncbi:MAG: alpha/beta hydrolase [Candidatus Eremiobacteraeota bacterium]|nr:alpha/beta hydrolase [Candidatus Eremiobacteraeota bacterium]MBV8367167.1 alpha/beta hydrolase [Candidatus Eremiobacteraeota bacterium]